MKKGLSDEQKSFRFLRRTPALHGGAVQEFDATKDRLCLPLREEMKK